MCLSIAKHRHLSCVEKICSHGSLRTRNSRVEKQGDKSSRHRYHRTAPRDELFDRLSYSSGRYDGANDPPPEPLHHHPDSHGRGRSQRRHASDETHGSLMKKKKGGLRRMLNWL